MSRGQVAWAALLTGRLTRTVPGRRRHEWREPTDVLPTPRRQDACDLRLTLPIYDSNRGVSLDTRPLDVPADAPGACPRALGTPAADLQHLLAAVTAAYA